jgi:hypothetical protein
MQRRQKPDRRQKARDIINRPYPSPVVMRTTGAKNDEVERAPRNRAPERVVKRVSFYE